MRKRFVALAAVFMILFVSFSAEAAVITVTNKTGLYLHYLYISSSNASDWEEDIMGDDVLAPDESVRVNVRGSYKKFDLKAVDGDGDSGEWYGFPGNVTRITIYADGTAEYK